MGRKQFQSHCTSGTETPYRKISREELLLISQYQELPASTAVATTFTPSSSASSSLRDSTPPPLPPTPSGPPSTSPSPALEHHMFAHKGSPDVTRIMPESHSMPFPQGHGPNPTGKAMYNGILEKSYSFGQLPASMVPSGGVGRYPSLTSLDSEGRSGGKEHKLQSTSSQDSSENGEKIKRSSSKIKSLFKKKNK